MEKIVHRFYGNGIVWNPNIGKVLCDFNKCGSKYETENENEIELLKKRYKFDKVVIEVEEKNKIKKEPVVEIKENKVNVDDIEYDKKDVVIEEVTVEEKESEEKESEEKELTKEDLHAMLTEKNIPFKKTQKLETLLNLYEEGTK